MCQKVRECSKTLPTARGWRHRSVIVSHAGNVGFRGATWMHQSNWHWACPLVAFACASLLSTFCVRRWAGGFVWMVEAMKKSEACTYAIARNLVGPVCAIEEPDEAAWNCSCHPVLVQGAQHRKEAATFRCLTWQWQVYYFTSFRNLKIQTWPILRHSFFSALAIATPLQGWHALKCTSDASWRLGLANTDEFVLRVGRC